MKRRNFLGMLVAAPAAAALPRPKPFSPEYLDQYGVRIAYDQLGQATVVQHQDGRIVNIRDEEEAHHIIKACMDQITLYGDRVDVDFDAHFKNGKVEPSFRLESVADASVGCMPWDQKGHLKRTARSEEHFRKHPLNWIQGTHSKVLEAFEALYVYHKGIDNRTTHECVDGPWEGSIVPLDFGETRTILSGSIYELRNNELFYVRRR